ncbi:MAG: acyl-CoA dehydrogenase family protein [Chloroflexi bacterium]|nr:acyl-CoA dehydrogenase family protein [Chloroflexota bacterium]
MAGIDPRPPTAVTAPAGGAFLVAPVATGSVFTPERLSPQHLAIRESIGEFVAREVEPRRERLEARDYATHRELMAILGHDGFVGIEVPEAYGGAGLDHVTAVVVIEALSPAGALAVTYAAHAGIGTLPTVFFGTDEQKRRHLPGLAAGRTIAAYALTEPGTGSDAQAIRTLAVRQTDGSYRLDGAKQFITNAGFADLFTVYARVEGVEGVESVGEGVEGVGEPRGIAAFLVERGTPGLEVGAEEHKLGIHGNSTCPLTLDGVIVPAENLLGTIGEGHRIAFNVLNVGRFKLAAAALGGMRPAVRTALEYAQGRVAFGRPIFGFPLVAEKIAGMAVRTYAIESMVYRIAGLIDGRLGGVEAGGSAEAVRAALEEYAVECSIAKVAASEDLDWVVDELVQVHGGYGYIEGYPAAQAYRDARINRIWEGTNEINRLLVPGTLIRRAVKGRLDLLGPARRAQEALLAPSTAGLDRAADDPLGSEAVLVEGLRQVTLLLAGGAVQRYGTTLEEEQEVLAGLADLAIALFTTESALVRARQARGETDAATASRHLDLARLVVLERVGPAELIARSLATRVADGDEARMLQSGIRRLLRGEPVDRIAIARRVAAAVETAGGYPV